MCKHAMIMLLFASSAQKFADAALCSNWDTSEVCGQNNDGGCQCLWQEGSCEKGTDCGGFGITSISDPQRPCTLADGKTEVEHGWNGKDLGNNFCNTCNCQDGSLVCTAMACVTNSTGCTLADQTTKVAVGWRGTDLGDNACNTCTCENSGTLVCTEIGCQHAPNSGNGPITGNTTTDDSSSSNPSSTSSKAQGSSLLSTVSMMGSLITFANLL